MKPHHMLIGVILALHLLYVAVVLAMPSISQTPMDASVALNTIGSSLSAAIVEVLVVSLCATRDW